jgi:nucleotide-binding universal stress UspA family protein
MSTPKIIVPVDGSSHSLRATHYAIKIAKRLDAEILLIHCHKPFPVTLGEPYLQKAITKRLENSDRLLQDYRDLLRSTDVPFTDRILEGAPGAAISEAAQFETCEMIIMGSRGRSDLKGLFLGSVAHRILHTAPCPVLIVK